MMQYENKSDDRRQQRIRLPFEKRSEDPGEWAYDHRVGLCITVIAYLIVGIVFMWSKIRIGSSDDSNSIMYIDLQPEQMQTPPEIIPERMVAVDYSDVRNRISNENAAENDTPPRERNDSRSEEMDEAQRVQESLRANQEAYQRGRAEIDDMFKSSNNDNRTNRDNERPRTDTKVKGTVTVSFSLVNPLRTSVHLKVPAYRCEGGGQVVVNITVNRNGHVTGASVGSASTSDRCLLDMALEAARSSQFNAEAAAPERHHGTITYIFIPQ